MDLILLNSQKEKGTQDYTHLFVIPKSTIKKLYDNGCLESRRVFGGGYLKYYAMYVLTEKPTIKYKKELKFHCLLDDFNK
jgi:hypothetical protein